ncbi:MAG: hypothetical protein FJ215_08620 [Ignavibacteria bacterium]|nr:hypothetical protein [Ignavibacteria bacterium]
MSLAQTLLSAAALVLLTVLVVNAHRLVVYSSDETLRAEARDMAVNAAQSLLNEIARKRFDQNANITGTFQGYWSFTAPSSLGPEAGESVSLPDTSPFKSDSVYNDVDDYHRYHRIVNTDQVKSLRCSVSVFYIPHRDSSMAPPQTSQQSYVKRVEVRATHPSYSDPKFTPKPDTLRFLRLIVH